METKKGVNPSISVAHHMSKSHRAFQSGSHRRHQPQSKPTAAHQQHQQQQQGEESKKHQQHLNQNQHKPHHDKQPRALPTLKDVFAWDRVVAPVTRVQLVALREHFEQHKDVVELYNRLAAQAKNPKKLSSEEQLAILLFSMSYKLTTLHVTRHKQYLSCLVCYDEHGVPMIELLDRLTYGDHVRLLKGRLLEGALEKLPHLRNEPEVIVKVYYSPRGHDKENPRSVKTCKHECSVYESIGSPSPYIPLKAFIWESAQVLVMKPLSPIDERHNPYEIGFQVVEQLWTLFQTNRAHSDLKPENIMAEYNHDHKRNKGPVVNFRLIDFEGCTKQQGSRPGQLNRRAYTKDFTMQDKKHDIDTSGYWDLRELVGVVNFLVGAGKGKRLHRFDHLHKMESPLLQKIDAYVQSLPRNHNKITVKHMERLQELFAKGVEERGGERYDSKMLRLLVKQQEEQKNRRHHKQSQQQPAGAKVANGIVLQDIRKDQKFGHKTRSRHRRDKHHAHSQHNKNI
jgi:hypothetical protein